MQVIRFELPGSHMVSVAAPNVQDAIKHLCLFDYFDGVDDEDSMEWRTLRDDEPLVLGLESDPEPDNLAMPGAVWNAEKRVLTAPAKSWADSVAVTEVISDSEA